ncbi:unnamed protein product [Sphagnum troendelagicum]|uniref:Uncharacterized protein n=1 Tax=Sphagnum troendelagicum TaxID=128251 RepID=A0ABP0TMX5_9BRYO
MLRRYCCAATARRSMAEARLLHGVEALLLLLQRCVAASLRRSTTVALLLLQRSAAAALLLLQRSATAALLLQRWRYGGLLLRRFAVVARCSAVATTNC